MSKIYFLFAFAMVGFLSSMKLDPKNPPTGQTGAPGQTTCSTAPGCHSGGTYTGTVELSGLTDTIKPSTEYSLTLKLSSTCVRTGFQITVLDKANKKCGDLVAGTNCNLTTANSKQYLRQSNPVNLAGGTASYSFKWKSPAKIDNDSAYFYFVMLQANGNGGTSGDNVAKGIKKAIMPTLSATNDALADLINIYPNPSADYINVVLPNNEATTLTMTDKAGKNVYKTTINGSHVLNAKELNPGMYIIHLQSKNFKTSKKVVLY